MCRQGDQQLREGLVSIKGGRGWKKVVQWLTAQGVSDRRHSHFFYSSFIQLLSRFFSFFLADLGSCRAQRYLAELVVGLILKLDGKKNGPCELSRSIASNLQAGPSWPRGPPEAYCHDGQLQQLINYAEAINALGKHSSDVLLLSFPLSLSPQHTTPPFNTVCRD